MKKYLILSAIAVLALGACSKNDIAEDTDATMQSVSIPTGRSLTKADTDYFVNAANFTGITDPKSAYMLIGLPAISQVQKTPPLWRI